MLIATNNWHRTSSDGCGRLYSYMPIVH
jgi:hypothetical protein